MAAKPKNKSASSDWKIGVDMERFHGVEPSWYNLAKEYKQADIIKAYNWYNYILNENERHEIVLDFITDEADRKAFKRLPPAVVPNTLAAKCRFFKRGGPVDSKTLKKDVKYYIDIGYDLLKKDSEKKAIPKPQAKTTDLIGNQLIADIEDQIDILGKNKYKTEFDVRVLLKDRNCSATVASRVANYYQPLLEELNGALTGKIPDFKEAYKHFKKKNLTIYRDMIADIIKGCESHKPVVIAVETKKKVSKQKKERKKKIVPVSKIVAKLKFLRESTELNIKSIDPTRLVGAKEVWLFNTKTRLLQHYIAKETSGFSVKGTSIIGFDKTLSTMKKIRKPQDVKPLFVESGPKAAIKDFNALKVKPILCNGRTNNETLLLRAIK